jgi:hypothetical protein
MIECAIASLQRVLARDSEANGLPDRSNVNSGDEASAADKLITNA